MIITNWLAILRIRQSISQRWLSKRTGSCESRSLWIKVHRNGFFVSFLLFFKTNSKSATNCMTQSVSRMFQGIKTVTHPSSSCTISTNVRKASHMITIWSTERHFFNCLINKQALICNKIKTTKKLGQFILLSLEKVNSDLLLCHHQQLEDHHRWHEEYP